MGQRGRGMAAGTGVAVALGLAIGCGAGVKDGMEPVAGQGGGAAVVVQVAAGPLVEPAMVEAASAPHAWLDGWTLVPLLQLDAGFRHAVVLWPMWEGGVMPPAPDLAAAVIEEGAAGMLERVEVVRPLETQPGGRRAAILEALGSEEFTMRDRGEGAPLEELGPRFVELTEQFRVAVGSGDEDAAVDAATQSSRLFHVEAFILTGPGDGENPHSELLNAVAALGWTLTFAGAEVVEPHGFEAMLAQEQGRQAAKITLTATGPGEAGSMPFTLWAMPLDDSSTMWVFIDHV